MCFSAFNVNPGVVSAECRAEAQLEVEHLICLVGVDIALNNLLDRQLCRISLIDDLRVSGDIFRDSAVHFAFVAGRHAGDFFFSHFILRPLGQS